MYVVIDQIMCDVSAYSEGRSMKHFKVSMVIGDNLC